MHTFSAIYLHVVFATWSRYPLLTKDIRPRAHAYLAGAARNLGLRDVLVGGVEDHVHLLAQFDPAATVSGVVGELKQATTTFIQRDEPRLRTFRWQRGFAVFSVSSDRVPVVRGYIDNQEEHHLRKTFSEELEAFLREFGVKDTGLL